MKERALQLLQNARASVKTNFRFATLNMIFIFAFVNIYQMIFGAENSIVGVIFTILMSSSMARDMTAVPLKHFLIQAFVLLLMGVTACMVSSFPPVYMLPVNFIMIFIILYAYTYEYASHLYFPYILSYLFLVFISPASPAQLPVRLLGILAGVFCIILYQLVMGRRRVHDVTRDTLTYLLDEAVESIECLLEGGNISVSLEEVRRNLCNLSRIVYERRRRALHISDASFAMIDSGRGLEHLIILLQDLRRPLSAKQAEILETAEGWLKECRKFLQKEADDLPELKGIFFDAAQEDTSVEELCRALVYIRNHLYHMTAPDTKFRYRKTVMSFSVRLKAALDISPVRVIYALRVALILSLFTLAVQVMELPHGKWLLFTLASVSMPYSDDVGAKAKKRFTATVIGGLMGLMAFSFASSALWRTVIMILSGYLSFYFSGYTGTFACSTVGALGGAVFLNSFGLQGVGEMLLIRLGYVAVGIVIAYSVNCFFFPFSRKKATAQLWEKYAAVSEMLTRICQMEDLDVQLYYSLVIQAHLLEDKLYQNSEAEGFEDMAELLEKCRMRVRSAHRKHSAENTNTAFMQV